MVQISLRLLSTLRPLLEGVGPAVGDPWVAWNGLSDAPVTRVFVGTGAGTHEQECSIHGAQNQGRFQGAYGANPGVQPERRHASPVRSKRFGKGSEGPHPSGECGRALDEGWRPKSRAQGVFRCTQAGYEYGVRSSA